MSLFSIVPPSNAPKSKPITKRTLIAASVRACAPNANDVSESDLPIEWKRLALVIEQHLALSYVGILDRSCNLAESTSDPRSSTR